MDERHLTFAPIRDELYTSQELSAGFDPGRAESIGETLDFRTYQYFVVNGRATPSHPYAGMMEALHDNSVLQAMFAFLKGHPRVTAVMGGHREQRGSDVYRSVALLGRRLSEAGFLVASGGGPGAMEATHLGALFSGRPQAGLDEAISQLAKAPALPRDAGKVVGADGSVDLRIARELHQWAVPAYEVLAEAQSHGESLAVPTWHYGHEPVTPLASHVAKYFQNSIREDVLLLLATQGIVFTPGRAGTVQEIFQDAAQNYYSSDASTFAPMVFFDADQFWSKQVPVDDVLRPLFKLGQREDLYAEKVLVTSSIDAVLEFIERHSASTVPTFSTRLRALERV
jgi:predicted Rossmann-fold nucleotide-binding protein